MRLPRNVYSITHNKTGKVYVGSSADVEQRYKSHIQRLRNGEHHIEDMQADFDTYGEDYTIQVLDVINAYGERDKEFDWMRKLNSMVRGVGYNYKEPAFRKVPKEMTPHEQLVREITEKVKACEDLGTLDFVLKFLDRSAEL